MSTRFHIFERVSIFSPLNTHSQKGARATRRIIQRSNSNNTSFILSTRRGNCRASISRKNVPFSRVEYMYILLVEHQLKETAQRRRDKAIDCNAIAREYKRRERERERGIGIKLQRNDIFFFFFFFFFFSSCFLFLIPTWNRSTDQAPPLILFSSSFALTIFLYSGREGLETFRFHSNIVMHSLWAE